MNKDIIVKIWRRGRGIVKWRFKYYDDRSVVTYFGAYPTWYTTNGWYCKRTKFTYRLTIDHDFPSKPLWLGRRVKGKWVNMEGLYEPLVVEHSGYTICNTSFNKPRRGSRRVSKSRLCVKWESTQHAYGFKELR